MKHTLSPGEVADRLYADKSGGWSYEGAKVLADYLCNEDDEDREFNVVDIRCEFSEYDSLVDLVKDIGGPEWYDLVGLDVEIDEDDPDTLDAVRVMSDQVADMVENYPDEVDDTIRSWLNKEGRFFIEFHSGVIYRTC